MQMSLDLNGDGGRHKAQLETGREGGRRWGSLECLGGRGMRKKKKKTCMGCLMPTWGKPMYGHIENTKAAHGCTHTERQISEFLRQAADLRGAWARAAFGSQWSQWPSTSHTSHTITTQRNQGSTGALPLLFKAQRAHPCSSKHNNKKREGMAAILFASVRPCPAAEWATHHLTQPLHECPWRSLWHQHRHPLVATATAARGGGRSN